MSDIEQPERPGDEDPEGDWVEPFDPNDTDQAPTDEALTEGADTDLPPDPEQEQEGGSDG